VALALAVSFLPGAPERLEYDRTAVVEGAQWWRLFSAQLVHWDARMALTDLTVVLLLGLWAERRLPAVTRALLLAGLPLIGIGIHLGAPALQYYRGSSPLASALFVLVALTVLFDARSRSVRGLAVSALALLALKLLREAWTGQALFAGPLPDGVVALPFSHLLGAVFGAFFAIIGRRFPDPN
jgi:rhomboid family GlyGly-CTERM serine protease